MAFIRTIAPSEAQGPVREMYQQVESRFGYVPNWAQAFSLRPGVRDGWGALLSSIQSNLPVRTYELATLAAARALRSCGIGLLSGQCLSLANYVAPTEAHGRDACRRRVPQVAYASRSIPLGITRQQTRSACPPTLSSNG